MGGKDSSGEQRRVPVSNTSFSPAASGSFSGNWSPCLFLQTSHVCPNPALSMLLDPLGECHAGTPGRATLRGILTLNCLCAPCHVSVVQQSGLGVHLPAAWRGLPVLTGVLYCGRSYLEDAYRMPICLGAMVGLREHSCLKE